MQISILTQKCSLVPKHFFNPDCARESLAQVVELCESDTVSWVDIPRYDAVLVYAYSSDDQKIVLDGESSTPDPLPELYYVLTDLEKCQQYNKILCSLRGGKLFLAIGQGNNLLLSNVYPAPDFTTAQYFIFLALKSLALNPEVSTISMRTPLQAEEEMSLYRYFKGVELI